MSRPFARRLLDWFDQHGRKDLPWQQDTTPYRVWVSEIMLQQTQVGTVIPYYQRFMERFPSVHSLATASADEVMHHWSGLGYYSRARNLHQTAKQISEYHNGIFPASVEALEQLPGIGRSTAGAILSIAFQQRAPILDGNVKRVLARHQAIPGWPGQSRTLKALWQLAEDTTPHERVADYTQAIMDLGATVCTRSKPACEKCPVERDCQARASGEQSHYPGKKPRKTLPQRSTQMLLIENASGELLLQKRPDTGIWGGLWSLPELPCEEPAPAFCENRLGARVRTHEHWNPLRHTFSHYHLDIQPVHLRLSQDPAHIMEGEQWLWYNGRSAPNIGLAAPVKKLLKTFNTLENHPS